MGLKLHVDTNNAKTREIRIANTVLNVARTVIFGRLAERPIGKLEPVISAGQEITRDENKSQSKCNFCGGTNMSSPICNVRGVRL